ncbi:SDR family NAD(P)-dependent oxidoreductase [Pseudonocardia sp. MH-G8]|uniref:SDR family NAD(P)-dependent oxidoreductase n=1 Tax=Pseudonocardia sp. MH-G8 TaxID=1854588 RepID=UPI000BA05C0F|nr:SDR family NAD(P)-dependent oxidoreductase [Pseudonocardia sp. MH-G8]OZM76766.1 3-hydroxyacyl-CoA dehydrogenase [Pseudonocardia sp. MH-G8]
MTDAVAVVTGAGQGVGLATAQRLSAAGHRVVLVGRQRHKLDAAAAGIAGPTLCVDADLTVPEQVEAVFDTVEREWGWAEVLVAGAGTALAAPITTTTDAQWQQMIDSNLTAPFRCIRRALPPMLEAGRGRIVVIASVVAKRGERQVSAYAASKHGALGLVRAVADEVARSGVTANAVCPGYVDTPMTDTTVAAMAGRLGIPEGDARALLEKRQPIRRLIRPDEVAAAVLACVENGAINGQGINVDGGAVQS